MMLYIGESLVGSGPETAHTNLVLGPRQGPAGIAFATALTYAVTGGKGLTDNTGALTANDVTGSLFYA